MAAEPEDKIVTLEQYYDPMLAHIMRTKLEDEGIPCFLADDNVISANPVFNQAVGGIKLKVFERDLQHYREILARDGDLHEQDHFEIDAETNAPVTCPYCSSSNVRFGPATENKVHWLTTLISAALLIFPFYARKAWHCFNCRRDFE